MGIFSKTVSAIRKGLARTREALFGGLISMLSGKTLSDDLIDDVEDYLIKADVGGTVGHAARLEAAPLRLEIDAVADPSVRAALEGLGVRLGRDGSTQLRIAGTLGSPSVR